MQSFHYVPFLFVEIWLENHSFGFLNPLDLQVNARIRRGKDALEIIADTNPTSYQGGRLSFPSEEANDD